MNRPYSARPSSNHGDAVADDSAFTADGFPRIGDSCEQTPEGDPVVVERAGNHINRAGETINAAEIEHLLLQHPDVAAAAAVAVPDPLLGEAVCVYIVADPTSGLAIGKQGSVSDVRSFAANRLGDGGMVDRLELLPDLPRTAGGEIDKQALRRTAVLCPPFMPPPPQPTPWPPTPADPAPHPTLRWER